jgi:hypothetical protein
MNGTTIRYPGAAAAPAISRGAADPVIALWNAAQRLHPIMDAAYDRLDALLRISPNDDPAVGLAHAHADALGREYEQLCEQICNTEARTLEGVLAKLQCAVRCIRGALPAASDPALNCDIELRFVFALKRDVERLLAG